MVWSSLGAPGDIVSGDVACAPAHGRIHGRRRVNAHESMCAHVGWDSLGWDDDIPQGVTQFLTSHHCANRWSFRELELVVPNANYYTRDCSTHSRIVYISLFACAVVVCACLLAILIFSKREIMWDQWINGSLRFDDVLDLSDYFLDLYLLDWWAHYFKSKKCTHCVDLIIIRSVWIGEKTKNDQDTY